MPSRSRTWVNAAKDPRLSGLIPVQLLGALDRRGRASAGYNPGPVALAEAHDVCATCIIAWPTAHRAPRYGPAGRRAAPSGSDLCVEQPPLSVTLVPSIVCSETFTLVRRFGASSGCLSAARRYHDDTERGLLQHGPREPFSLTRLRLLAPGAVVRRARSRSKDQKPGAPQQSTLRYRIDDSSCNSASSVLRGVGRVSVAVPLADSRISFDGERGVSGGPRLQGTPAPSVHLPTSHAASEPKAQVSAEGFVDYRRVHSERTSECGAPLPLLAPLSQVSELQGRGSWGGRSHGGLGVTEPGSGRAKVDPWLHDQQRHRRSGLVSFAPSSYTRHDSVVRNEVVRDDEREPWRAITGRGTARPGAEARSIAANGLRDAASEGPGCGTEWGCSHV